MRFAAVISGETWDNLVAPVLSGVAIVCIAWLAAPMRISSTAVYSSKYHSRLHFIPVWLDICRVDSTSNVCMWIFKHSSLTQSHLASENLYINVCWQKLNGTLSFGRQSPHHIMLCFFVLVEIVVIFLHLFMDRNLHLWAEGKRAHMVGSTYSVFDEQNILTHIYNAAPVPVFLCFVVCVFVVVAGAKTQHELPPICGRLHSALHTVQTHTHIFHFVGHLYLRHIVQTMCAAAVKFTFVPLICRQLNRAMSATSGVWEIPWHVLTYVPARIHRQWPILSWKWQKICSNEYLALGGHTFFLALPSSIFLELTSSYFRKITSGSYELAFQESFKFQNWSWDDSRSYTHSYILLLHMYENNTNLTLSSQLQFSNLKLPWHEGLRRAGIPKHKLRFFFK